MTTLPREFKFVGLVLAFIAVFMPAQVAFQFGDSPLDPSAIAVKLAPLNWVVMALAIVLALLARRASRGVWYVAPLFLGSVVWNNWLVASVQTSSEEGMATFAAVVSTTGAFVLMALLLRSDPRRVLSDPRLRWWLTPKRRRVGVSAKLCPVLGGELVAKTFDISEGGAFIAVADSAWTHIRMGSAKALAVGEYCSVRLSLNHVSAVSCVAQIVRRASPHGAYPEGIGIRFVGLSSGERRILVDFLQHAAA